MDIMRFTRTVEDAMMAGRGMRIVLKGGEVLEGIPERIRGDFSNRPSAFSPPLTPETEQYFGPAEHVVTISGTEILAQEVAEYAG